MFTYVTTDTLDAHLNSVETYSSSHKEIYEVESTNGDTTKRTYQSSIVASFQGNESTSSQYQEMSGGTTDKDISTYESAETVINSYKITGYTIYTTYAETWDGTDTVYIEDSTVGTNGLNTVFYEKTHVDSSNVGIIASTTTTYLQYIYTGTLNGTTPTYTYIITTYTKFQEITSIGDIPISYVETTSCESVELIYLKTYVLTDYIVSAPICDWALPHPARLLEMNYFHQGDYVASLALNDFNEEYFEPASDTSGVTYGRFNKSLTMTFSVKTTDNSILIYDLISYTSQSVSRYANLYEIPLSTIAGTGSVPSLDCAENLATFKGNVPITQTTTCSTTTETDSTSTTTWNNVLSGISTNTVLNFSYNRIIDTYSFLGTTGNNDGLGVRAYLSTSTLVTTVESSKAVGSPTIHPHYFLTWTSSYSSSYEMVEPTTTSTDEPVVIASVTSEYYDASNQGATQVVSYATGMDVALVKQGATAYRPILDFGFSSENSNIFYKNFNFTPKISHTASCVRDNIYHHVTNNESQTYVRTDGVSVSVKISSNTIQLSYRSYTTNVWDSTYSHTVGVEGGSYREFWDNNESYIPIKSFEQKAAYAKVNYGIHEIISNNTSQILQYTNDTFLTFSNQTVQVNWRSDVNFIRNGAISTNIDKPWNNYVIEAPYFMNLLPYYHQVSYTTYI